MALTIGGFFTWKTGFREVGMPKLFPRVTFAMQDCSFLSTQLQISSSNDEFLLRNSPSTQPLTEAEVAEAHRLPSPAYPSLLTVFLLVTVSLFHCDSGLNYLDYLSRQVIQPHILPAQTHTKTTLTRCPETSIPAPHQFCEELPARFRFQCLPQLSHS